MKIEPPYETRSQRQQAALLRKAYRSTGAWRCHLCGRALDKEVATIDHLVPQARGGSKKSAKNVKLACFSCNNLRGTQPIEFFKMKMCLYGFYPWMMDPEEYER